MKRIIVAAFVVLSCVAVETAQASTSTTVGLSPIDREYTRLVVGDSHSCVLLNDGAVKCWGDNTYGQLGVPEITDSATPVSVSSFGNNRYAVELAAGKNHTCALLNDASISCWGENNFGSLGDGTSSNTDVPTNVQLSGIRPRQIAAGGFTSCLLDDQDMLYCWGRNNSNQLGSSVGAASLVPIEVEIGITTTIETVAVGNSHVCVIANTTNCWGSNSSGQLGNGTDSGGWPDTQVSSYGINTRAVGLSLGSAHSCVVLNIATSKCWGNNGAGRLGDQSITTRHTPSLVVTTEAFRQVSSGTSHSCGLTSHGEVFCWGTNSNGRLGNSSTTGSTVPVRAHLPAGVTARQIATGDSHSCALLDNDDVMCWGNNTAGKLGDGTEAQRLVPTKVIQLRTAPGTSTNSTSDITHNAATINTSFSTGDITAHRGLEYGTDEFLAGDTEVISLGYFGAVRQVASGDNHSCMVIFGGHIKCWGDNSDGALGNGDRVSHPSPVDVQGLLGDARTVAVGSSHSCAVLSTGQLKCWGDNSFGQLGDGSVISSTIPVAADLTDVIDVVLGNGFTCALRVGGSVSCWGKNTDGQLGSAGESTSSPSTVSIDANHTVMSLVASSSRVCVVLSNATVKCWGKGITGIASPGSFSSSVASISAADNHACAVLHNGTVQCWGDDSLGQLGDGSTDSSGSLVNAAFTSGDVAVAVSSSADTSCAVLSSGTVKCWGSGEFGVTALGSTSNVDSPAVIAELATIVQVSLAQMHGCALAQQGEVWCWGSNSRQQRGTSTAAITRPEMMSSHINASISTELTGLSDDTSYFYRVVTTSTQGVTEGAIHTFNTSELPVSSPVDDDPLDTPLIDSPTDNDPPQISPPEGATPDVREPADDTSGRVIETVAPVSQVLSTDAIGGGVVSKKKRPSVKIGSLTPVTRVLQRLDYSVPKPTSTTKMWMTVLTKRVCRVYGGKLWAIRTGRCQLMVLKMSPSRRLTMSRTQIKVVRQRG